MNIYETFLIIFMNLEKMVLFIKKFILLIHRIKYFINIVVVEDVNCKTCFIQKIKFCEIVKKTVIAFIDLILFTVNRYFRMPEIQNKTFLSRL